jgi:chemotaxis methyl-accepting protein methylase
VHSSLLAGVVFEDCSTLFLQFLNTVLQLQSLGAASGFTVIFITNNMKYLTKQLQKVVFSAFFFLKNKKCLFIGEDI